MRIMDSLIQKPFDLRSIKQIKSNFIFLWSKCTSSKRKKQALNSWHHYERKNFPSSCRSKKLCKYSENIPTEYRPSEQPPLNRRHRSFAIFTTIVSFLWYRATDWFKTLPLFRIFYLRFREFSTSSTVLQQVDR